LRINDNNNLKKYNKLFL